MLNEVLFVPSTESKVTGCTEQSTIANIMTFIKITHSAFKRLSLEISAVEANSLQHYTIFTFLVWHTAQGSETAASCGR